MNHTAVEKDPDISPAYTWDRMDAEICKKLIKLDNFPQAIKCFRNNRQHLTDYGYWFFLSTLWVQRTDGTSLDEWKKFFSSDRPNRDICIMKPSELKALSELPEQITAYRAHRPGETDWISYTTNKDIAVKFALRHKTNEIVKYRINKADVFAFFTRRNEDEIIVLDRSKAIKKTISILDLELEE